MPSDLKSTVGALSEAKALAIAGYGESVAAYRYRTLAEKATTDQHRAIFVDMAEEEQEHHAAIKDIIGARFPQTDFVLSPEDKELVIVGSRMLDVSTEEAFRKALGLIHDSERQTGSFYATLHDVTKLDDLKPLLKEMADECFGHAERLKSIPPMPWAS